MICTNVAALAGRSALAVSAIFLAACADAPAPLSSPERLLAPNAAPLLLTTGVPIASHYIVVLKSTSATAGSVDSMAAEHPAEVQQRYHSALNGLAVTLDAARLAEMRADPRVAYIEQDGVMTTTAVQTNAPWTLDRIDQRALPLSGTFASSFDGTGVSVYLIDTGINYAHTEFGGRASLGFDAATPGGTGADCFGHGTGTAGILAGKTYGVAKNVHLYSVRVMDCVGNGSHSVTVAGIDWVTAHHASPAVANLSLGGGFSSAVNQAIQKAIASGVTFVVAAGNAAVDACTGSPGSAPGAIAVGATSSADDFATFSDYGPCVALNAPGVGITTSSLSSSNSSTSNGSGTSYAAPNVAGAAALYLQANPTATPAQVRAALIANATPNVIHFLKTGTPNKLLYTGFIVAPPPVPPTANFTSACPSLVCTFDASSSKALGTATYAWNFGDGTTATGKTAIHTYAATGAYAVTLTVTDANGTSSKPATVKPATVSSAVPVARFTWSCPALQCTIDASTSTSGNGIVNYTFDWGNGRSESRTTPLTKNTWASAGIYTITLTVTDASGRVASIAIRVPIGVQPPANQAPVAAINTPSSGSSYVLGTPVSFSGSGNDAEDGALSGSSLSWTSSIDGVIGTGVAFSSSALSVGTHTITLKATDSQGATGTATQTLTVTAPVVVNQPPVPRFTWSCPTAAHACSFDASTSTASAAITSYKWAWGDGRVESHPAATARNSWPATASFSITLTVTDANGLSASVTNVVAVP